jgi:hypothetical protein
VLGQRIEALGEALDVDLVDDRVVPRDARRAIVLPVEGGVDDHGVRHRRRAVRVVGHEVVVLLARREIGQDVGGSPLDGPVDRLRVGVEQQLRRVEAQTPLGVVGTVDAIAVALSRSHAGQEAVPGEEGGIADLDALLDTVLVEEAEIDALGVLGEEREVRSRVAHGGAERERIAGQHLARLAGLGVSLLHRCAAHSGSSTTRAAYPPRGHQPGASHTGLPGNRCAVSRTRERGRYERTA